ncbi:FAD-binding domain-containing protein [Melanomma pulvis-pyrius CBS 109.77]|uniref:FAD-binding domain-containing protein n=1 Tax=Melanomma pulvis-pyrius CBS 109.77 TaxID=1314802 RepID=A0A6A6XG04_9PLEO|nr:FAD-binding domain-containing protein [Melanomma pulvis-pyrius CBS 109.77]
MATQDDLRTALSPICIVTIPSPDSKTHDHISRWSNAAIALPHAIVTPTSIPDILSTIAFASTNGLKIVPATGGHGSFIPVNRKTIYLDMSSPAFKSISLNEEKEEVKIGGGVLAGEVIKELATKGWHTLTPNSDAVGMVGALLGGLSGATNGIHGFGIDHIKSISIVPFSRTSPLPDPEDHGISNPAVLTLTPDSKGEEKSLFNALCGAGHGLGIVTSVTLSAFRLSALCMTDNKIWTRRLIFPAAAIRTAVKLYIDLLPPPPTLAPVLVFVRAPPSAPVPDAAMLMLALSYFGPAGDAELATRTSFEDEYVEMASMAVTGATGWGEMNASSAPMNAHGGVKESYSAFVKEMDGESLVRAFEAWEAYSSGEGRGRTYTVFSAWDTEQLLRNVGDKDEKFFPARDRGVFVQCTPWYADVEGKDDADRVGKEIVDATREKDRSEGRSDWGFANNLVVGGDLREVYSGEQIGEVERVRGVWDPKRVGWCPGDGW